MVLGSSEVLEIARKMSVITFFIHKMKHLEGEKASDQSKIKFSVAI